MNIVSKFGLIIVLFLLSYVYIEYSDFMSFCKLVLIITSFLALASILVKDKEVSLKR